MKLLQLLINTIFSTVSVLSFAQQAPVNCDLSIPGCSTPNFVINGIDQPYDIQDFGAGTISNPDMNPQNNNDGCLLTGETISTFITITVVSAGTLEWSMIGVDEVTGNPTGLGCFDWIMWPNIDGNACTNIQNNTLPPVSCNWNNLCNGNTGMASPGNIPPQGGTSDYQPPLNVNAGDQFVLCLSNFSFTDQNVNFNFFGTSEVTCSVNTPDQTICLGSSATVNVIATGLSNPTFNWLVTTGVSNPASGTGVIVTPTVTTEYIVQINSVEGNMIDTFTIFVVPPPTPDAGSDMTICQGEVINLSGTSSSPNSTITWTHTVTGNTGTPTVNYTPNAANLTPTVTTNQAGVYTFSLSEDNAVCPLVTDEVQVVVSSTTHTTTWVGPSCTGMTNGSITIHNPDAVEYSFDGGVTWVNTNTKGGFGVGTYVVRSRNAFGCVFNSTVVIGEPSAIVLTASADTIICQNGIAMLNAQINAENLVVDYIWSGSTSTDASILVGPFTTNQTFTVQAQTATGCISNVETIQVIVRDVLSAQISPFDTICPGYPTMIDLSAIAGGLEPYSITWSSGQVGAGNAMSIEVNPDQTTIYTVVIDDACETDSLLLSTQIFVAPLPVPAMSVVEPIICEPAIFEIHLESDTNTLSNYVWHFATNQTVMNEPVVFTEALAAGSYDVTLVVTSTLGCIDSITNVAFLTSQQKPNASFSWSPNPVTMFNTEVSFQNTSFLANEYEWTFEEGVPSFSTLERPKVTFPSGVTGVYPVQLIVTSEWGCKDTLNKDLIVSQEVILYAPTAFTPDGDEFNQVWKVVPLGLDPFAFNLKIFNRWGEIVFESNDIEIGWDGMYNGKVMPTGVYNWKISAGNSLNDDVHEWNGHFSLIR